MGSVYFLVLSFCAVLRVASGGVGVSDLAIFHSAFLMTFKERFYFTYLHPEGCLFFQHFDPIIMFILPFYAVLGKYAWPVLPISQAFAFGLAFPALHKITRIDGVKSVWAYFLLALMFFSPVIHNILMYDFHPFVFSFPLLLWGWVFLTEGRNVKGHACWGLALMCKENVSLTVAALGLSLFLGKRRKVGLIWTGAGLAYFVIVMGVLLPSFREIGRGNVYLSRYTWLGGTTAEMARTILLHPYHVLKVLTSDTSRLAFIENLLLPLGLLPLFAPRRLLAVLPEITILLLSSFSAMHEIKFHYPAALMAVLFIAASGGLSSLIAKKAKKDNEANLCPPRQYWRKRLALLLCLLAAVFTFRTLYREDRAWPLRQNRREGYYRKETRSVSIDKMGQLIPSDSTLSLPLNLLNPTFPFVERPLIAFLPDRARVADYVIFDLKTRYFGGHKEEGLDDLLATMKSDKVHEIVFKEEGFIVLHRKGISQINMGEKRRAWREYSPGL